MVLLKRKAFKAKHKIQDHWEKTIYHVEGQPYVGLPVSGSLQLQGKVRLRLYTKTCYSPLEATLRGILGMREVNKVSTDLKIASWQSLMMGFQETELCCQILNP